MYGFMRILGIYLFVCLFFHFNVFSYVIPDTYVECGSGVSSVCCDGKIIAFSQSGAVKFVDMSQAAPAATTIAAGNLPSVSDGVIVWESLSSGYYQIFAYDIAASATIQVTADNFDCREPSISGGRVVYRYKGSDSLWHIAMKTITDGQVSAAIPICTAPRGQYLPAIDGDIVVWHDTRNSSDVALMRDIYLYDLSANLEAEVCTAVYDQRNPIIGGDTIVWQDYRNGSGVDNSDIYAYSISKRAEYPICTRAGNQVSARTKGGLVVYVDTGAGFEGVYLFDTVKYTTYPLTSTASSGWLTAVSQDLLLWYDGTKLNVVNLPFDNEITILSPSHGGAFFTGRQSIIEWMGADPLRPVDIMFSPDGGISRFTIATSITNAASCQWLTPRETTVQGIITISYTDQPHIFFGSGLFRIQNCDADLTADLSGDCYVGVEDLAILASQWMLDGR